MPPGVRGTGPTPGGRPAHCLFLDNPNSPSRVWGLARALWALAFLACARGPLAGFAGPAGAQAKICGPFSWGKFCPQTGPLCGARVPAWPKAKPPPWAYKPGLGELGQSMCVCAFGAKRWPGAPLDVPLFAFANGTFQPTGTYFPCRPRFCNRFCV